MNMVLAHAGAPSVSAPCSAPLGSLARALWALGTRTDDAHRRVPPRSGCAVRVRATNLRLLLKTRCISKACLRTSRVQMGTSVLSLSAMR